MGFFDRIKDFIAPGDQSSRLLKEYNIDGLIKESRLQFKETETIEDAILDRYKKYEKKDFQKEILEKHLKTSQDELIKFEQEQQKKQEISDEVDKTLDGESKDTKEKVKQDLLKEDQEAQEKGEQEEKPKDPKERKKQLEARVCKVAYKNMYKEYTEKVMATKEEMQVAGAVAMSTEKAVEMIGYEKSLEKLEVMYHNRSGKEFSQDKEINKKREEFKAGAEAVQRGTDIRIDERVNEINRLYAQKQRAHEKYMEALYIGHKSPAELSVLKQEYKEAVQNLVTIVPSLQEYVKDVGQQQKNEDLAREKGIGNESSIKNKIDINGKDDRLDRNQSRVEDKILNVEEKKEAAERTNSKHYIDGNDPRQYEYARNKTEEKVVEENLAEKGSKSVGQVKEDVKIDLRDDRGDFLSSLQSRNQLDTPTDEQLRSDAYYDPEAAQKAALEERKIEESKRQKDEEMVREIRDKKKNNY